MVGTAATLLGRLLARGDVVAVDNGRLTVTATSGAPVPAEWLQQHRRQLIAEAAQAAGVDALEYLGYTAGKFGGGRYPGVDLQFRSLTDNSDRHGLFNAELHRDRSTKHGAKGSPLPPGQFRVRQGHKFYKFWLSTGLPEPRRLSAFHDYMGKLASLVFTGTLSEGERLEAGTLRPLSLTSDKLSRLLGVNLPDNSRTSAGQFPDNSRTRAPDKESPHSQQSRGLEPNQATGEKNHGNTVIRERGYTGYPIPPEEQTNEQWLADYEGASRRPKP